MDYDDIIIGSGFGGSVSALRLSEKGYKVLVIEKGRWFKADDFPKTNWNFKKWLWMPYLRFFLNHEAFRDQTHCYHLWYWGRRWIVRVCKHLTHSQNNNSLRFAYLI